MPAGRCKPTNRVAGNKPDPRESFWLEHATRPCWAPSGRTTDPEDFDIERKNDTHLTFGAGPHTCLGNYLARLEAQIALSMLLRRYERIELCDPRPPWSETLLVRGPKSLNVVFE